MSYLTKLFECKYDIELKNTYFINLGIFGTCKYFNWIYWY